MATVSSTRTEISQLMLPHHANMAGAVYGGTILSIADSAAYACAARHAGPNCVTVSVDKVDFHEPIRIGELVTFVATVCYTGKTSMDIAIEIYAEDFSSAQKRHTNSCIFTMVCMDPQTRRPAAVPSIEPQTPQEKKHFEQAKNRRAFRKQNEKGE